MLRSPTIYITTDISNGKPQVGNRLKAVRLFIASNVVPYLQMTLKGSHSTSERGRKRERERERERERKREKKEGEDDLGNKVDIKVVG